MALTAVFDTNILFSATGWRLHRSLGSGSFDEESRNAPAPHWIIFRRVFTPRFFGTGTLFRTNGWRANDLLVLRAVAEESVVGEGVRHGFLANVHCLIRTR